MLNMIIKPTLHSIHKFDHQRFHTPTATSFSLQIILSSSVARLTNLEKKISLQIKKHFIPRFFPQEFNWKVKCLRLNLKSNATITSNQIMNLDVQLSAALHELQNYLIFLSQLPVFGSTKSTPKKIIHTPSLNPPFSALDEDV